MAQGMAILLLAGTTVAAAAVAQPPRPAAGTLRTGTGCLQVGDGRGTFLLSAVKWTPLDEKTATDGTGHHQGTDAKGPKPSAVAQASAEPDTVRLAGPLERLEVHEHVGHTVTATGMLSPEDPVVSPAIVLPDAPKLPHAAAGRTGPRRAFNIQSLTQVRKGCGSGK